MAVFNIVRFRLKPDQEAAFLAAHDKGKARWPGLIRGVLVRIGENSFCLIGEWPDRETLVAARPAMIATLDTFRALLDDLGEGKGITDAVSGEVALSLV